MPARRLRLCNEDDALRHYEDGTMYAKTGGSDGGGTMDNLEKRVTNLEGDVKVIREDLTTLKVRSENFATKSDVSDIRIEMAELRGDLKSEMAALRGDLNTAIVESKQSILNAIAEKSRWKWGSIVIPLAAVVVGAILSFVITRWMS